MPTPLQRNEITCPDVSEEVSSTMLSFANRVEHGSTIDSCLESEFLASYKTELMSVSR
jgi:hypothetical protein